MTSTDQGTPSIRQSGATGGKLPTIVGVRVDRKHYRPPRLFVRRGKDIPVSDAIDVIVSTSGPIPTRALSPVLWVGAVPLTESDRLDDQTYIFYGIEPDVLVDGASLALGWSGEPSQMQSSVSFARPK